MHAMQLLEEEALQGLDVFTISCIPQHTQTHSHTPNTYRKVSIPVQPLEVKLKNPDRQELQSAPPTPTVHRHTPVSMLHSLLVLPPLQSHGSHPTPAVKFQNPGFVCGCFVCECACVCE